MIYSESDPFECPRVSLILKPPILCPQNKAVSILPLYHRQGAWKVNFVIPCLLTLSPFWLFVVFLRCIERWREVSVWLWRIPFRSRGRLVLFLGSGTMLIMQVLVLRLVLFLYFDSWLYHLGLFYFRMLQKIETDIRGLAVGKMCSNIIRNWYLSSCFVCVCRFCRLWAQKLTGLVLPHNVWLVLLVRRSQWTNGQSSFLSWWPMSQTPTAQSTWKSRHWKLLVTFAKI